MIQSPKIFVTNIISELVKINSMKHKYAVMDYLRLPLDKNEKNMLVFLTIFKH